MLNTLLSLAVLFLVIALVAGFFGFIGVGSLAWEGAQIFFVIFLILAVLSFVSGYFYRDRPGFWSR
jgi:uncharacterized membrane protein YtjA (UPF0391 family)